jgi:hypothetical protein
MTLSTRHVASGIRFNDCIFSEPVGFANWMPPGCPGLYAVLTFDPNWAPRPLRPVYFGEFGNNTPLQTVHHECRGLLSTESVKNLFVCMVPMPFTTTLQRCTLRDELIAGYNPACQNANRPVSSSDLAQKLDDLERRHLEQNAQMMMLVAGVNRFFDPPPPQPRRRIGFNPLSEPAS